MNDLVKEPEHYKTHSMECIDEIRLVFGNEAAFNFCVINTWKYRNRVFAKDGERDIKKSDRYLEFAMAIKRNPDSTRPMRELLGE